MPTIPRRWPAEVEEERIQALGTTNEATQSLQTALEKLDHAREKLNLNPGLVIILLADADRHVADAMTRTERIRRYMVLAKAKPIDGRWPMGIVRQRDEIEASANGVLDLLDQVHDLSVEARTKVNVNPVLAEAALADMAQMQARSLTLAERMGRLLVEAGIGRD